MSVEAAPTYYIATAADDPEKIKEKARDYLGNSKFKKLAHIVRDRFSSRDLERRKDDIIEAAETAEDIKKKHGSSVLKTLLRFTNKNSKRDLKELKSDLKSEYVENNKINKEKLLRDFNVYKKEGEVLRPTIKDRESSKLYEKLEKEIGEDDLEDFMRDVAKRFSNFEDFKKYVDNKAKELEKQETSNFNEVLSYSEAVVQRMINIASFVTGVGVGALITHIPYLTILTFIWVSAKWLVFSLIIPVGTYAGGAGLAFASIYAADRALIKLFSEADTSFTGTVMRITATVGLLSLASLFLSLSLGMLGIISITLPIIVAPLVGVLSATAIFLLYSSLQDFGVVASVASVDNTQNNSGFKIKGIKNLDKLEVKSKSQIENRQNDIKSSIQLNNIKDRRLS